MATAMLATSPSEVSVLRYSDSWDSLGYDRDSVVGYGSLLMYK
jgi:predicted class III extradiol MEMO1 family dioxygenase